MGMLSLFPQILFLAPFGTTLLRVAAGIAFAYVGFRMIATREEMKKIDLPIVGHPASWMISLSALITIAIGLALFVGFGTQAAAIIGALIAAKHMTLSRRFEALRPLSRGTYALLAVICLSFIVSGAGLFAFDLPL